MREYEHTKGKELDDELQCAALTMMCPDRLQDHINLNISRLSKYSQLREEITLYLQTLRPADAAEPAPMDIGALGKGAFGKGGKGKGFAAGPMAGGKPFQP